MTFFNRLKTYILLKKVINTAKYEDEDTFIIEWTTPINDIDCAIQLPQCVNCIDIDDLNIHFEIHIATMDDVVQSNLWLLKLVSRSSHPPHSLSLISVLIYFTVSGTVKWNMMIPWFPESTGSKNDFHVFSQAF